MGLYYLPVISRLLTCEFLAVPKPCAAVESLKLQSMKHLLFGVGETRSNQDPSCISDYCSKIQDRPWEGHKRSPVYPPFKSFFNRTLHWECCCKCSVIHVLSQNIRAEKNFGVSLLPMSQDHLEWAAMHQWSVSDGYQHNPLVNWIYIIFSSATWVTPALVQQRQEKCDPGLHVHRLSLFFLELLEHHIMQ